MSERNYYVLCDDNCRFEGMTKEQIIAAIAEATGATPTHIDDAFITKMKEQNENANLTFWVGTQAEYNAIDPKVTNCLYIITDSTDEAELEARMQAAEATVASYAQTVPFDVEPFPAGTQGAVHTIFFSSSVSYPSLKLVYFNAYCFLDGETQAGLYKIGKIPLDYVPHDKAYPHGWTIPLTCTANAFEGSIKTIACQLNQNGEIYVSTNETLEDGTMLYISGFWKVD